MSDRPTHGTRTAYRGGCRCSDCREAQRAYMVAWKAKRRAADAPHGTDNGYSNYGCRCDLCKAAHSARVVADNERLAGSAPSSHGTDGYRRFGCRCGICVEAQRALQSGNAAARRVVPGAPRRGLTWTGPELELLAARDDLSPRDKAILLGRTVRAVETMLQLVRHDPKWMKAAGVDDA